MLLTGNLKKIISILLGILHKSPFPLLWRGKQGCKFRAQPPNEVSKKKTFYARGLFLLAFAALLMVTPFACKKKDTPGEPPVPAPTPLAFTVPAGWPQPQYDFAANPLTKEGFELGRKLFYDTRLSSDGQVSCGSCHQQFAGFVLFDHDLGHGVNNNHTLRNPQPLFNLAWHKEMMWDGGINHIEVQPLAPITDPNEMGETITNVIEKLKANAAYRAMFKAAFGDETITSQRMLKALTQFMLMIVSNNSKYDRVKQGAESFTTLENIGYQVFQTHCATCHKEPLFTDLSYRNTGLPISTYLNDKGRMRITGNRSDSLKFKVPSLRNVALTYPYTHDGRIYSLDQMVDHYRFNVVNDFSTDPLVRNKIALTITEKAAVIAFMKTLTDTTFTKDRKLSEQP
jgi:cytochrome c peroxidase